MKDAHTHPKWMRRILPAVSAAVLLLHTGLLVANPNENTRMIPLFAVLVLSLLVLNLFVWKAIGNVFQKLSLLQDEALRKRQMEHIVRLSRQSRGQKERILRIHHDLKNHLGVLYSMLQDGRAEQADRYIGEIQAFLKQEDSPK